MCEETVRRNLQDPRFLMSLYRFVEDVSASVSHDDMEGVVGGETMIKATTANGSPHDMTANTRENSRG